MPAEDRNEAIKLIKYLYKNSELTVYLYNISHKR